MESCLPSMAKRTTPASPAKSLRKHFEASRDVTPRAITGRETPHQILTESFPAYVGR